MSFTSFSLTDWLWAAVIVVGLAAAMFAFYRLCMGPMFRYDLVRTARRDRYHFHRWVYGILLLCYLYYGTSTFALPNWRLSGRELARFAADFFQTIMLFQLLAIFLVTPGYVAGAIAEQRENRSLEFLFATELTDREIVVNTLLSRLANLSLLLLTSLPIISLLQFLGGIDPNLVLAFFLGSAGTMLSLGAISMFFSVISNKTMDAYTGSYFGIVMFLILTYVIPFGFLMNPIHMVNAIGIRGYNVEGISLQVVLIAAVPYFVLHVAIACAFVVLAYEHLRGTELDIVSRPTTIDFEGNERLGIRHPPDTNPMLWKELFSSWRINFDKPGCGAGAMICGVLFVFATALRILLESWTNDDGPRVINSVVQFLGTPFALLMLLVAIIDSCKRVADERKKQTLECLLITPLESAQILAAKWLASLHATRLFLWFLVPLWILGVITGGLHLTPLFFMVLTLIVHLCLFSSMGIFFSTVCSNHLVALIACFFIIIAGMWFGILNSAEELWTLASIGHERQKTFDSPLYPKLIVDQFGRRFLVLAMLVGCTCLFWTQALRNFNKKERPLDLET